jgi:hypothetical protein
MTSLSAALLCSEHLSCFLLLFESRQRGISEAANITRCCLGTIHRPLYGTSAVCGALLDCLAAPYLGTLLRCIVFCAHLPVGQIQHNFSHNCSAQLASWSPPRWRRSCPSCTPQSS